MIFGYLTWFFSWHKNHVRRGPAVFEFQIEPVMGRASEFWAWSIWIEIIHRDLSFLKTNLFLFDQYVSLICAKFDPNVIYNNP